MQGYPTDEWTRYGGLRMHVRNWGGAGRPVVLLHGLASTCRIWDFVASILARDFAVIAVDQRGHGDSGKPEHGYDFASVAGDAAALLEGRGIQSPVLVGHSWGADVALELAVAQARPAARNRVRGRRHHRRLGPLRHAGRRLSADGPSRLQRRDAGAIHGARALGRPVGHAHRTARQVLLRTSSSANFETLEDGTLRAKLSRDNHLRIIRALWDHHPRELYPRVSCPVLMMPARQREHPDAYERTLARSESIAAAERLLPNSKTVWLENSIHDVPVQRPELVAETIREHILGGFFD